VILAPSARPASPRRHAPGEDVEQRHASDGASATTALVRCELRVGSAGRSVATSTRSPTIDGFSHEIDRLAAPALSSSHVPLPH